MLFLLIRLFLICLFLSLISIIRLKLQSHVPSLDLFAASDSDFKRSWCVQKLLFLPLISISSMKDGISHYKHHFILKGKSHLPKPWCNPPEPKLPIDACGWCSGCPIGINSKVFSTPFRKKAVWAPETALWAPEPHSLVPYLSQMFNLSISNSASWHCRI